MDVPVQYFGVLFPGLLPALGHRQRLSGALAVNLQRPYFLGVVGGCHCHEAEELHVYVWNIACSVPYPAQVDFECKFLNRKTILKGYKY